MTQGCIEQPCVFHSRSLGVIRAFVLQCARFSVMFMMTPFVAMTFVVAAFSGCCCLVFAIGSVVYALHKTP
jgi:hypothetical protein